MKNPRINSVLLLTLSLLLLALVTPLHAQRVTLGPKAGVSITRVAIDGLDTDYRYGFTGGGFVRVGLGSSARWHLQPELLFTMKGTGTNQAQLSAGGLEEDDFRVNTLDIPLLAGFHIINNDMLRLSLRLGPSLAVKLSSSDEVTNPLTGETIAIYEPLHVNAVAGIGLDVWKLTFDARYEGNISNIRNDVGANLQGNRFQQSLFSITAGFKIL